MKYSHNDMIFFALIGELDSQKNYRYTTNRIWSVSVAANTTTYAI